MPDAHERYFKQFMKFLETRGSVDIGEVRRLSQQWSIELRGRNDLYARKYHAHIFTRWCEAQGLPLLVTEGWNKEGFWDLGFH